MNRQVIPFVAALAASLVVAFWPVLSGGFLFDDFANLKALGEYGPIRDIEGLARYLTSGIADPLGRPIAMASFLLDARSWPADPAAFLRSNLILHVLNALLLVQVLTKLGGFIGLSRNLAAKSAVAAAAFWALHPLWVSTVGYVVQRHAMLATSFVLLGILAWLMALTAFRRKQALRGWLWAGLAMPACGVLAALSKANGMLLPILVLTIHFFVLARSTGNQPSERHAIRLLLVLPSLLLIVAILASIEAQPTGRPWSTAERVMSQPRAVLDYLIHLLVPRVNSVGLFADGFEVSRSWLSPALTLPATLFVLCLAVAPFALRQRHPVLAGALAFFLAGHVMESTVLPLELYFEHRNYLPAMLLGWPLALHLLSHPWQTRTGQPILVILLAVLALTTHQRAELWADAPRQAAVWAQLLPESPRAQTWAGQHEVERGELEAAQSRLLAAVDKHPRNLMLAVNLLDIECARGELTMRSVQRAAASLAHEGAGEDVALSWMRSKIQRNSQTCPQLDRRIIEELLRALATGSTESLLATSRQRRLEAMFALSRRECARARQGFEAAQAAQRWASEAYADSALLASQCGPEVALTYLEPFLDSPEPDASERPGMLRVHQWVLRRQGYWREELRRLHSILRSEVDDGRVTRMPASGHD